MLRQAFFFGSFVTAALIAAACSDSSSNNNTTNDGGSSSGDGGGSSSGDGGSSSGDGGGGEIDAGPLPYGSVPPAAPTVYTCTGEIHVATTGDDTTGDGTSGKPYKTIAKATPTAKAGDCVKVHAGTYMETTSITFAVDGAVDKPVVLQSADGKGMAIVDGTNNTTGPVIDVKNDHIVIDGFDLKSPVTSMFHVVRFDGQYNSKCVGSTIRNSKVTGGVSAIKIFQKTQGVLVENNELYGKSGNVPVGLTGASGLVFRANYCHDWDSGDNGAVQLAGGSANALFEKNLFQDVATFAGTIALGDNCGNTCDNDPEHYGAVNAKAVNNVFIRSVRAFDVLACKNCSILNNTIIDTGRNNLVFKLANATTNGQSRASVGTRIINNLVTSPRGLIAHVMQIEAGNEGGLQMDYNLFWNSSNGITYGDSHPAGQDAHSLLLDPTLTSPTDFRPLAGSPAIGAGTNLVGEVPQDFLSVARPASGGFDIGAYQH